MRPKIAELDNIRLIAMPLGVFNSFWFQSLVEIRAYFHFVAPKQFGFQMRRALNSAVKTETSTSGCFYKISTKSFLGTRKVPVCS